MVWCWPLASDWGFCKWCKKLKKNLRTWCDIGCLQVMEIL
jgi:hypothetical protein